MAMKQYGIDEICELTGFSRRTIRYYVQEGLLPPPAGRGRGGFYNDSHLERLRKIRALREKGLGLSAVASVLAAGGADGVREGGETGRAVWVRIEIAPGLEIAVRRDLEQRLGRKVDEIVRVVKTIIEEDIHHGDD